MVRNGVGVRNRVSSGLQLAGSRFMGRDGF